MVQMAKDNELLGRKTESVREREQLGNKNAEQRRVMIC